MSDLKDVIYKLNRAKLDYYDNHYVVYSDRLSSACRQLAFSEGAVFWILKTSALSLWIMTGLLALVLFFCVDIFQYYFGMKDYENSAAETRAEMNRQEFEDDYQEIKNEGRNPNKRLERCFKYKLSFLGISSAFLIIVFFKHFYFVS